MNTEGPITGFLNKIFNMIALSIMWLVGCLPVVTIGASTAALYYTAVKVCRKDTGYLHREFFKSYKQNLKQGCAMTIIVAFFVLLLLYNRSYMKLADGKEAAWFAGFYTVAMVLIIALSMYMFPVLSRFHMTVTNMIKLSFFAMIRYFFSTVLLVVIFGAGAIVCIQYPLFLVVIPGLVVYVQSFVMERVLHKFMEKPEAGSDEEQQWYNI